MRRNIVRRGVQLLLIAALSLCTLSAAGTSNLEEDPVRPVSVTARSDQSSQAKLEIGLRDELKRILHFILGVEAPSEEPLSEIRPLEEPPAEVQTPEEPEQEVPVWLTLPNGWADRLERYEAWAAAHPELKIEDVVFQVNMDQDQAFYSNTYLAMHPNSPTVLVNKHSGLSSNFYPQLEALGKGYGSGSLSPAAAQAFRAMADGARASGISLVSVSAYRSYETQKSLYNGYLRSYGNQSFVDGFSARPGFSEHQTGLALDINVSSFKANFEKTPAFAWLKAHCAEYGFILRYDQGKEDITGYRFEPWHYRYVGVEIAKVCMSQGLAYEEYLALQPG